MKTMQDILIWHATAEELPKTSGEYLAMSEWGFIHHLSYSAKYQKFNIEDDDSEDKLEYALDELYWAVLPALCKETCKYRG